MWKVFIGSQFCFKSKAIWLGLQIILSVVTLGLLVWLILRCTEDGCPHKKFFHTRFLMRMRLTPDCSKMLISTSSGYLLILHDLDLTKSLEVGSYPILRARRTTSSSGKIFWLKDFLKTLSYGGFVLSVWAGKMTENQSCSLGSLFLAFQGWMTICVYQQKH